MTSLLLSPPSTQKRRELLFTCKFVLSVNRATQRAVQGSIVSSLQWYELIRASRFTFFYSWFFGASGGAGIARGAFPRMYNNVQQIQALKGVGPTLGGDKVGLSFLCGYPEDVCIADVEKICSNKMPVDKMVEKFPVEGNFLVSKG